MHSKGEIVLCAVMHNGGRALLCCCAVCTVCVCVCRSTTSKPSIPWSFLKRPFEFLGLTTSLFSSFYSDESSHAVNSSSDETPTKLFQLYISSVASCKTENGNFLSSMKIARCSQNPRNERI